MLRVLPLDLAGRGLLLLAAAALAAATPTGAAQTVNYRSIGTAAAPLYDTGTATVAAGSRTVTFADGASLPVGLGRGDRLVLGGGAAVTRQESVTGTGTASTVTMPSIAGGPDQTYVLFVATRNNRDVTSVTGGGLAWIEQVEQCGGGGGTGARLWTARGSPAAAFQAVITCVPGNETLAAVLTRYTGVALIEGPAGRNTNGDRGACTGGTDDRDMRLTLTSTLDGSVHVVGGAPGRWNINSVAAGYVPIDNCIGGSGQNRTRAFAYEKAFTPGATEQFTAGVNQDADWSTAGVVLRPPDDAGATLYVLSRDSADQVTVQEPAPASYAGQAFSVERAFGSLQAWEDARGGDLAGDGRAEVGVCRNDGPLPAGLLIGGSTTDPAHSLTLTAEPGERHGGVAGAGVRLDAGGGLGVTPIRIEDPYVRVEWIEVHDVQDGTGGVLATGPGVVLEGLLLHDLTGPAIATSSTDGVVRNSVIYGATSAEGLAVTAGSVSIDNCTIYGGARQGVRSAAASAVAIRNTIAVGNALGDFQLAGTILYFGNNMFGTTVGFIPDAYDGDHQSPPQDLDDLFVSIAPPYDLHLEIMGHAAVNGGLDLSAEFTSDVDGQARQGRWEIGADDLPPSRRLLQWVEREP